MQASRAAARIGGAHTIQKRGGGQAMGGSIEPTAQDLAQGQAMNGSIGLIVRDFARGEEMKGPCGRIVARVARGVLLIAALAAWSAAGQPAAKPQSVAPVVATPASIVDDIMALANVGAGDFVVDLGSGDGRIVIAAVARHQARGGFGVDIDAAMVALANENAAKAGVADRVRFYQRDLFDTDVRDATVVTVYLLPGAMDRVERKLLAELRPGARVVAHDFPFPQWRPERTMAVDSLDKLKVTGFTSSQLFLYRVPERR